MTMRTEKTRGKTRTLLRRGFVPGNPGNAGGQKGRSGRKPIAFKAECERLTDEVVLPRIAAYLAAHDPADPGFRWSAEFVAEYGKGRPNQALEVVSQPASPPISHAEMLPRLRLAVKNLEEMEELEAAMDGPIVDETPAI